MKHISEQIKNWDAKKIIIYLDLNFSIFYNGSPPDVSNSLAIFVNQPDGIDREETIWR